MVSATKALATDLLSPTKSMDRTCLSSMSHDQIEIWGIWKPCSTPCPWDHSRKIFCVSERLIILLNDTSRTLTHFFSSHHNLYLKNLSLGSSLPIFLLHYLTLYMPPNISHPLRRCHCKEILPATWLKSWIFKMVAWILDFLSICSVPFLILMTNELAWTPQVCSKLQWNVI